MSQKIPDDQARFLQLGEDARYYQDSIGEILQNSEARENLDGEQLKGFLNSFHLSRAVEVVATDIVEELQNPIHSVGFREKQEARKRRRFFKGESEMSPTGEVIESEGE